MEATKPRLGNPPGAGGTLELSIGVSRKLKTRKVDCSLEVIKILKFYNEAEELGSRILRFQEIESSVNARSIPLPLHETCTFLLFLFLLSSNDLFKSPACLSD